MDPNAALRNMREAISRTWEAEGEADRLAAAEDLAVAAEALDSWLSTGGFLPSGWAAAEPAA